MNHSQANAGALVRAVLESVDTAIDPIDCTDEDLDAACALLDGYAKQRAAMKSGGALARTAETITTIAEALRALRVKS